MAESRPRIPRFWPAAALLTGVVLVFALAVTGDRVDGLSPSTPTRAYRIVYRIDDRAGVSTVRTEIVEVRRPYNGRLEARTGRPPGEEISSGRVTNREFEWHLDDGGELQFGDRRPPGTATRHISYTALRDAVSAGRAEAIGRGDALGRTCTWFAFRDPFPEALAPPTDAGRVEACVDPDGILLRENWTIGKRLVRAVEAVELDLQTPPDERFLLGKEPTRENAAQPEAFDLLRSQRIVADDIDDAADAIDRATPRGWKRDRQSVVIEAGGGTRPTQVISITYVRGTDVVVLEVAGNPEHKPSWSPTEGISVDLDDGFNDGRLVYFTDRVELRIVSDDGFARVLAPSRSAAVLFGGLLAED